MAKEIVQRRKSAWLGWALLIALAAFVRLYRIGDSDTRADEVQTVQFLRSGYTPWRYFLWMVGDFKEGRQMPLPRVLTSAFVYGLGLKATLTTVRWPYALAGLLVVPGLWLLGRHLLDRRLGWILAFLGAINPYGVYWSRVGHVYAFVLPGLAFTAAFLVAAMREAARGERPRRAGLAGACAASMWACYSHLSAWPLVGLLWLLLLGAALRAGRWSPKAVSVGTWIAFGAWAASLLPWALTFVSALFTASSTFIDTYGDPTYSWRAMWRLPFVMNWGGDGLRAPVTILLLAAGVFGGLKNRSTRLAVAILLGMMVLLFGLLSMMMGAGKGLFSLRYYSPLWLLFTVLSGLGLATLADAVRSLRPSAAPGGGLGDAVLGALLLGVTAMPLSWIIRLPGNPTPYTRINQWMDEHLPAGTPVIVDRWFEPNHEMRFHAPSRVRPTFTIPNEPLETFLQYNWRETVRRFVQRHPDAAYLEMIKSYFYVPVVGPWDWPGKHFARHMAFTNEPALALRRAVLAPSEDYYAVNTNRVVVELFYNLKEDLVNQARAAGLAVVAFYGDHWEFTKTQDYRDWRVLQDRATVELYNLTEQPLEVRLVLRGAAPGRSKRVQSSLGATETFPPNQMQEWTMTVEALPPGRTEVVFTDALWTAAQVPLLVDNLRAEVVGH